MAHDLDVRQFFRRSPKEWLRRYFERHGVLSAFDWTSLGTRNVDPLMEAWLALDADFRGKMVEDFSNIKMLATPAGKVQIIDEAAYHPNPEEVSAKLSDLDDFYACAFRVYFDRHECWNGAVFYAAADSKPKRYWRKRINLPRLGRRPTDADGTALAAAITELFRRTEGRGDHCVVHQFRRGQHGEREYYFAYPQDHRQTAIEYDRGEMTKRPYSPAFEIVFIHNDEQQTLNIWHDGTKERVKDLQVAFAQSVLGKEILRDSPRDDRAYDFEPFLDPDLTFSPVSELGIADVEVRKIRVRVFGHSEHTVRIDLGNETPAYVLYERLAVAMQGIQRSLRKVSLVGLRVTFNPGSSGKQPRPRSFELVWPSSSSLRDDEYGVVIQRMLSDHGIEPRPPNKDNDEGG